MADKKISALTSATLPLAGTEVVPLVQSSTTKKVAVSDLTAGRDVQANNVLVNLSSAPGAFNNTIAVSSGASNLAGLQLVNNAVGAAYNTGLQVFLNGTDGAISSFNGPLQILTGGYTIRAEYDLSGNYKVNNGNVIVGTAGKGIDFSANTHAAGMTSELLNDYEEGAFTPNFNTLTIGNGTLFGRYTKVGRVITCEFGFIFGSTSSFSGTVGSCGGFPYASRSFGTNTYSIINGAAFDVGSNWYGLTAYMARGADFCIGPAIGTTAPFTWAAGDTLVMTAIYEVA